MTKAEFLEYADLYDDNTDINQIMRDIAEERAAQIEELEEEQHRNGFYAFQDKMALWRYER